MLHQHACSSSSIDDLCRATTKAHHRWGFNGDGYGHEAQFSTGLFSAQHRWIPFLWATGLRHRYLCTSDSNYGFPKYYMQQMFFFISLMWSFTHVFTVDLIWLRNIHQRVLPEIHLANISRHSLGLYSGAVCPAPWSIGVHISEGYKSLIITSSHKCKYFGHGDNLEKATCQFFLQKLNKYNITKM